ncbi:MAG: hypothetical protein OK456_04145 [Thaumarchaeota archaeon]|nr:hypothetical protein [Nitrososphaerota archaeon]
MENTRWTSDPAGGEPLDTLAIYGFSFRYPASRSLEFNPKFKREQGDVAVKSPEKAVVFFSWGDLAKLQKTQTGLEAHAKFSLEKIKKSVQGKMVQVERRELTLNGHPALFNHVKVEVPRRGLVGKSGGEQEVRSLHLHCPDSGRYYVVYATSTAANSEVQSRTLDEIVASVRCH